jgi:hypothetical protein
MLCLFWWSCKSPQFVIPAQFDAVMPFQKGVAPAKKDALWGFIDTNGIWVIKPQFKEIIKTDNAKVLMVLANGDRAELIKNKASAEWEIKTPAAEKIEIQTSLGIRNIVKSGDSYIISDHAEIQISRSLYDSIRYGGDDVFVASKLYEGDLLIHADGRILSPFYNEIDASIQFGRIRFRHEEKYGLMSPSGDVILEPSMWRLEIAGKNIACTRGGKLELHTDKLQKISDLQFDHIQYFLADRWMAVNTDTGIGTIFNAEGKVIAEDIFVSDGVMKFGLIPARIKNETWGYLDYDGKQALDFQCDYTITFWNNGTAGFGKRAESGQMLLGIIDTSANILLPATYEDILFNHGVYTVIKDKKFQLLNEKMEPLTKVFNSPVEYTGDNVYVLYKLKTKLAYQSPNWYLGRKMGIKRYTESKVKGIYALDGQLLVSASDYNEDDLIPQCMEGFVAAKSGKLWGFVKCTSHKSLD